MQHDTEFLNPGLEYCVRQLSPIISENDLRATKSAHDIFPNEPPDLVRCNGGEGFGLYPLEEIVDGYYVTLESSKSCGQGSCEVYVLYGEWYRVVGEGDEFGRKSLDAFVLLTFCTFVD